MPQSELLKRVIARLQQAGMQHGQLDQGYLDEWSVKLRLEELLALLRAQAEPID